MYNFPGDPLHFIKLNTSTTSSLKNVHEEKESNAPKS